jgi:CBS-domain-containing membrane protein
MTNTRTKLRIRDFMTPSPDAVGPEVSLTDARATMARYSIRHLPVLDADGALAGVVSERDLSLLASMPMIQEDVCPVSQAMRDGPFTCGPEAQLHAVAAQMSENRYGCALVVSPDSPDQVLGIFTTTDALRALIQLTQPYLRDPAGD